ncbi:hypothetical protein P5V15_002888 [Pogonomyrmex californicus]
MARKTRSSSRLDTGKISILHVILLFLHDSTGFKGAIKKCKREFLNLRLDESIFKGCGALHPVENKALYIACNKTIICCKTDLIQHSRTVKYIDNVNSSKFEATDNVRDNLSHKDKVKRAEIELAAFFREHNVAFYTADHLVPLKDIYLSLSRNKCANIVKNVIAKRKIEKVNTDISNIKVMCILVRYVSPLNKKITTQLLELLQKNIPIKNIVEMACDNASIIVGCNNSFISYSACEKLPSSCENLIRVLATYISESAKRCAILVEFQDFFEIERTILLRAPRINPYELLGTEGHIRRSCSLRP